jgi:hypothetical protein
MIAHVKARSVSCSFCGKSRSQVTQIVAGAPHISGVPRVPGQGSFICNECVRHFNQLLANSGIKSTPVDRSNLK